MAPKSSKTKDTDKPKRPQSSYFLWMNANREAIKKPGMSVSDVAKAAGAQWRAMSAAEKTKWEKKAAEDKQRYEEECAEYTDSHQTKGN